MSALGQEQTCALQNAMSALPPKATLIAFFRISAKGQKRTGQLVARLCSFLFRNLAGLFLCAGLSLWYSAFLSSHPFCDPFLNTGSRCSPYASKRIGSFSGPFLY